MIADRFENLSIISSVYNELSLSLLLMDPLKEYIEDIGLFYEQYGLPKMAGRVLGYLMATSKIAISFDDLVDELQASKGSISGNIKLLISQHLIEKYSLPGNRKSYFRISYGNISRTLEDKISSVKEIINIYVRANQINDSESEKHRQLEEMVDFYRFLEVEIPKLKQQWAFQRKREN